MTFSVAIHSTEGQFEATLVGAPDVHATAATREEALAKLELAIVTRVKQGELVSLEVPRLGPAGLFGRFRDDPTLAEICQEAFKERDADVQR